MFFKQVLYISAYIYKTVKNKDIYLPLLHFMYEEGKLRVDMMLVSEPLILVLFVYKGHALSRMMKLGTITLFICLRFRT